MPKIFNNTSIFQQVLDTIIWENIPIDEIKMMPVSVAYKGQKKLCKTSDGEWLLPLKIKSVYEDNELDTVYKAFFVEQYRFKLRVALEEYILSEYGSRLLQKLIGYTQFDGWMRDALVYYLSRKNEICNDIRLLEAMLKDVFNTSVKMDVEERYVYQKGAVLRDLVLGTKQAIGGRIKSHQQNLICTFSPKTQEESMLFYPGGKWFPFLHDVLFRHFIRSAFYPIKKITPILLDEVKLNNGMRLGVNKIVIV